MSPAYVRLEARFREAALLGEASAILGWDHATMMPAGAAEGRAEQLAYLGRPCGRKSSAPARLPRTWRRPRRRRTAWTIGSAPTWRRWRAVIVSSAPCRRT